jgi:CheY-like chemotaxis protein
LLTFSKGGAPVRHTVALGDCLHESTVFALRGSNVRSDLAIATDLWPVEADVGQLHQVIHNVVRNAAQAMPHGGTVQVRAENMVVHPGGILPLAEGRYLKITVTDQGGGIPADILPKIFDPYFTTKARGNGLGLATTYAIVTKHDGYIHAASEVGVGTTFFIYLPASSQAPASAPASRTEVTAGSGRILVMDDDAVIRKLLAVMLPSLGYEVTCVPDGAAAVEAYHQAQLNGHAFAAVILDITIPGGMGGVDTLHQLRALDPQVKAFLSSGYADDAVMATYAQYGFAGVIPKPYAVAQVHDALHRLLGTGQTAPSS